MSESKKIKYKKIRIITQIILITVILIGAIIAVIKLWPIFSRIQNDEAYRNNVISKIDSFGSFSWIILILIQILQTILAVIPAGPVVMLTGIMYDPWLAVIICLAGQTLGALCVIGLVKLFGTSFIALFIDPESTKKFKLLDDSRRCGVLMFSYLLIPILPKDPIAFVVPFTKVKTSHFAIINTIARTPMTIVTVIFGNALITGNITTGLIIGICCAIVGLGCLIFNKQIVNLIDSMINKIKPEKVTEIN